MLRALDGANGSLDWLPLEILIELLLEHPADGPADYEIDTSVRLCPVVIDRALILHVILWRDTV